jgi:hypothetical protein
MRAALRDLAAHFERQIPRIGRYARHPAVTNERGIVSLPPDPLPKLAAGIAVAAGLACTMAVRRRPPS